MMRKVPANKGDGCLAVSHICGSRKCCKRTHLLLEPKHVNDGRTHCHFLPHVLYQQNAPPAKIRAMVDAVRSACPHRPRCFSYLGNFSTEERVIAEAPRVDVTGTQ